MYEMVASSPAFMLRKATSCATISLSRPLLRPTASAPSGPSPLLYIYINIYCKLCKLCKLMPLVRYA